MNWEKSIHLAGQNFDLSIEYEAETDVVWSLEYEALPELSDTYLIRFCAQVPDQQRLVIQELELRWAVPITDMHGLYFGGDPRAELGYLPFWKIEKDVAAQSGLPYMALVHRDGHNRAAYGALDQITETRLSAELSEITRCYHMSFQLPANHESNHQRIVVNGSYEAIWFISLAQQAWPDVLKTYAHQVQSAMKHDPMYVPDKAYDPVYCTWTAIHHDVSHDWIMKNAPLAAELGFRTWLTDDGWFLENGVFGDYAQVGDWVPSRTKFPDMREHVRAVQAFGFNYVLWVAPFMIGDDNPRAKSWSHILTTGQPRERFRNLSPWHTETARIVSDLLRRLIVDYDLDGLKIDFIDAIDIHSERKAGARDISMGEAVYDTLKSAIDELYALKSHILIEFRNRYTNLASRSYANLYRSSDVPINPRLNRWQASMLRLLAPDRAVHMDPMLWHPQDSDENVAVHLINGIASVPMISIELDQYPASHIALIRHWIGFYNEHRQTIVRGDFCPRLIEDHIPLIDFIGTNEIITGLYEDVPVNCFDDGKTHWILNGSAQPFVDLRRRPDGACQIYTFDKFGHLVSEETLLSLPERIAVEVGGSVVLTTTPRQASSGIH